jgi:signal peptidase II
VLLGMILGGALSNGVDRLVQGSVVDFIDFHFWPVFNVADSCIVVAIILLLVFSFFPPSHSPTSSTSSAQS